MVCKFFQGSRPGCAAGKERRWLAGSGEHLLPAPAGPLEAPARDTETAGRWSAQVTARTSCFLRRRIPDASKRRQQEPVLTARGLSLGLCRGTCASSTPALLAQFLQSFVGTADRSKLMLLCYFAFFPVYFFFFLRALRFFLKSLRRHLQLRLR